LRLLYYTGDVFGVIHFFIFCSPFFAAVAAVRFIASLLSAGLHDAL